MSHKIREAALWLGAAVGALSIAGAVAVIGLGYSLMIFRSGSMEPEIPTGGLALARTVDAADLRVGDVVSVDTAAGARVTHRIVDVNLSDSTAALTLQGDANRTPDDESYSVTSAPRVVTSVPLLGYVVAQVLSPLGLLLVGAVGVVLVGLGLRSDRDGTSGPGRRRLQKDSQPTPVKSSARGRVALMGAASAAVLAAGVTMTSAAFTDVATGTATASAAKYFTCDQAMLQTGLAPWSYQKFDESQPPIISVGAQTATDSSGNSGNRNLTYRPSPLLNIGARYQLEQVRACGRDTGTAVTFNGSGNNPSYASSAANIVDQQGPSGARWNTFTVSVWFKSSTAGSRGNLISMGDRDTGVSVNHDRHVYLTTSGNLVFGVYPGEVRDIATTGTDYSDSRWHMVTASLSSTGMRLWVDGQPAASRSDVITAQQMSSMYWRVGYETLTGWNQVPNPSANSAFGGTMDEFGIWTKALSNTEVLDLYRSAKPNP